MKRIVSILAAITLCAMYPVQNVLAVSDESGNSSVSDGDRAKESVKSILTATPQYPEHTKFGLSHFVRGSIGFAMHTGSNNGNSAARFSFNAGYGISKNFTANLGVEGNLNISMKGYKGVQKFDILSSHAVVKFVGTSWNAELAALARYGNRFSVGLGPYLGIGLGGKYVITATVSETTKTAHDYFGKTNGARRCDFGLVYDLRYSFSRYMLGFQMMNGLIPIGKVGDNKNFGGWFYVGYRF